MAVINFFAEDVSIPAILDQKKIVKGLKAIAKHHTSAIEGLNYIFCSDEHLLSVNKEYLQHDYYTDIITFPYKEGAIVEGDIFISVDRVIDNAKNENEDEILEFYRVMAHGLLHLIGFKDKTEEDQNKMTKAEDEAIAIILGKE